MGEVRRTISLRSAARVTEQAGLYVGEVERAVVVGVVAVGKTQLLSSGSAGSGREECQNGEPETAWLAVYDVHDSVPVRHDGACNQGVSL